jgi:hypothetical protein
VRGLGIEDRGYPNGMSESQHEHGHGVVDEIKSLEHEAEVGESARTPAIVLSGVALVVLVILVVIMVIAFTAYYLTK